MNKVRALDAQGDWVWGIGLGAYRLKRDALAQQIRCAILSFLGDCYYDINAGINWFGLLGTSNQAAVNLAVASQILNLQAKGVTGLVQVDVTYNSRTRQLFLQYQVQTIYGQISNNTVFNLGAAS